MGFDVPAAIQNVGKAIEKAADDTAKNVKKGATYVENKIKGVEKKTGVNINAGASKSTKFGDGQDPPPKPAPAPPPDLLTPGYGDPYAGFDKEGYTSPGAGGQFDLGRPGDPSNPLLPTPVPWDNTSVGVAPENPPAWEAWVPPETEQVRRLRYRKFAKERGL